MTPEQKKLHRLAVFIDQNPISVAREIDDLESRIDTISKVLNESIIEMQDRVSKLKDGKNGKDGKDGKTGEVGPRGLQGAPGRDGTDGKDGRDGKDGLQGLQGPQGLMGPIGRAFIGGRVGVQVLSSGTKVGTKTNEINFSTGLTATNSNGRITVAANGGGFTKVTTASTINDSNKVFVFASAPTYLIINGSWYDNTVGDVYTWTGTTTITLNNPVGIHGKIWGFY